MGNDSGPQATLTDIHQLSKHVSGISPTFVMIDQVSGPTKTVILAHFIAQEGGQSYLHLDKTFWTMFEIGTGLGTHLMEVLGRISMEKMYWLRK